MKREKEVYRYSVNGGEERFAKALHLGKHLTIVVYRKVKHRDRLIQIDRDKFFGTGTTILIFSRF